MHKLKLALAIVFPLVGCTATVGDDSGILGGNAAGTFGSGGAAGPSPIVGSSGSASGVVNSGSGGTAGSNPAVGLGGGGGGGFSSGSGSGSGGTPAVGGTSNGGACSVAVLPAGVQTMLANRCVTCHGSTPLAGLPALFDYASLTAPAKSDPTKTNAVVALARLQSASMPMPPAPGAPATASEIAALQDFITQGYPKPVCMNGGGGSGGGSSSGGSAGMGGSPGMDPLNAMPTCTSMSSWSKGNQGSASMNPGLACISCHKSGEGPSFNIAGTVYPTGHEPDRCNSSIGNAGAKVVIIGADGKQLTLTPNSVGNFSSNNAVKTPYQAKVTYQGRERLMLTAQTSGDCNSCHTQNGSMMAPGRITAP